MYLGLFLQMKSLETEPCKELPALLPVFVKFLLPGGEESVAVLLPLQVFEKLGVRRPGQQASEPAGLG